MRTESSLRPSGLPWRLSPVIMSGLIVLFAATTAPAQAPRDAAEVIKERHIGVARNKAADRPRSEGDQVLIAGWPLYRTERGQTAFNDAMATLKATEGPAPKATAFQGCVNLACPLALPRVGPDGWIPAGRAWVAPDEYVLFVHSPKLRPGQSYRRRGIMGLRYFVFHEFHNGSRNTDTYDTISSHSGAIFVPFYLSKQGKDAKGRRYVVVVQVAPYDVVSIHATNYGSAGPGVEVAKNVNDELEPLQATAGVLLATIVRNEAPRLRVVNHRGAEGLPMLKAYERRLEALKARATASEVILPFVPATPAKLATASAHLGDLIARPGVSPTIPVAERAVVPRRPVVQAAAPPRPPVAKPAVARSISPLAAYLKANLATLKQQPDLSGIIPQDVKAVAEVSPDAGVVYLLAADNSILGRIEPLRQQGITIEGKYVFASDDRAVGGAFPFALDISKPAAMRVVAVTAPVSEPAPQAPALPAPREEPPLVEPVKPAEPPACANGGQADPAVPCRLRFSPRR